MQASPHEPAIWHGTTIVTVRKDGKVVIGGDGQVSVGQTVIKSNARKVRRLGKPALHQRHVVRGHRPEDIGQRRHLPHSYNVSMVTLRLV